MKGLFFLVRLQKKRKKRFQHHPKHTVTRFLFCFFFAFRCIEKSSEEKMLNIWLAKRLFFGDVLLSLVACSHFKGLVEGEQLNLPD